MTPTERAAGAFPEHEFSSWLRLRAAAAIAEAVVEERAACACVAEDAARGRACHMGTVGQHAAEVAAAIRGR